MVRGLELGGLEFRVKGLGSKVGSLGLRVQG
jgi:hypothetical protein